MSSSPATSGEHQRRTGWVVGPLMLVEAATARWLLARVPPSLGRLIPGIGVVLLALIWGSTAFLQVPAHRQLERAFAELVHRRLVRTNWIRTSLWTARSVLALRMLLLAP